MTPYIPPSTPAQYAAAWQTVLGDLPSFAQLLKIKEKSGSAYIPFVANEAQQSLWRTLDASNRVIVVKARQVGVSTAVRAWQFHRAYAANGPETYALLSVHERSAKGLRRLDRAWQQQLHQIVPRPLSIDSAEETIYADTGAGVAAYTTGGRYGTRSFVHTGAHLTEFAFYADPDEVLAQTLATASDRGSVVIESTADRPGSMFEKLALGAPGNGWALWTYWWWQHQPYAAPALPADWARTAEEEALAQRYGLSDLQLAWRRAKILELGSQEKFRREYPACLEDAFVAGAGGYYENTTLDAIQVVEPSALRGLGGMEGVQLEPPQPGDRYVMGVDVGAGVGGDYSAMAVISVSTQQPVYIARSNRCTPVQWAHEVVRIASLYAHALVLVESNNHGNVVLHELRLTRYQHLWAHPETGKDWTTTLQSKLQAHSALREALQLIRVLDRATWMELRSLVVPPGKLAPEAPLGGHDDLAMALALAYRAMADVPPGWRVSSYTAAQTRVEDLISQARARRIRSTLPF